jgi:branched-chain amino acid transport system permease protein
MVSVLQNLIYGVQLGSLYALIALGYTMVYGVLRLINFAHGDVYMVGAFVGFYACMKWLPFANLSEHPEAGLTNIGLAVVVLLMAMGICAALGMVIERFAYRPLRNGLTRADAHFWGFVVALPIASRIAPLVSPVGLSAWLVVGIACGFLLRPVAAWLARRTLPSASRLNALITAIGVSLVLQNGGILLFGATPNFIENVIPERTLSLGGIQLSTSQIAILIVSVLLMLGLRHIVLFTRRGRAMRAISHDIEAAKLMGVDTDRVISFTFALGAALAGAGGFMVAALMHFKITPLFGLQPGLKAFVAAVLGGAGNIPGAAVGGVIMGVAETFVAATYSSYTDAIAFCILILILLFRPSGILGRHVPEKV